MSSFVTVVPPPGISQQQSYALLEQASTAEELPADAPRGFIDALIVRKRVFVDEQGCRLSEEIDDDDARAWHWLVNASVAPGKHPVAGSPGGDAFARRKSVGGQVPVGTMRLVPPPHGPHPAPGSVDGVGGADVSALRAGGDGDVPTKLHDGREAYVKLGRLATIKEYRGLGLGRLVVSEAIEWLARNPDTVLRLPDDPLEREKARRGRDWRGLVLAHSQLAAVKFYGALGFEVDPDLGEWVEEGITHVAMWKRIDLKT